MFASIFECIFGEKEDKPTPPGVSQSPEDVAGEIINKIFTARSRASLHEQLNEMNSTCGWSDMIVRGILQGIENAIKSGATMGRAARDAVAQSEEAAIEFASNHPVYSTVIALGVMALLTPWALEILGFGELGPIEGSWAAAWQRTYAGQVSKEAIFTYFQRLGMEWHWIF